MPPFINRGLSVNRSGSSEELSSVMTLATGTAMSSEIEIRSFQGKDWTVVPVVAIVEGVLHGANAQAPEFAAASEFGKFPKAWDGRPVVMNHPQLEGVFVSASIPQVLEDYGMGFIFNSRIEDKKLKCEAWLDHTAIEALGEESELFQTLERIRNNEMVEVSVGAWLDSIAQPGTFEGKKYARVWKNVAPDHLAFLSEGVKGACSNEDGCGVPRLFSVNAAAIGAKTSCCEGCSAGTGCEGAEEGGVMDSVLELQHRAESFEGLVDLLNAEHEFGEFDGLTIETVPSDMDMRDIRTVVFQGLLELLNIPAYDVDIIALTSNGVVYYQYGRAGLWMREYSIDDSANISFSGDDVPVNLLTRILPRQTTEPTVEQTQENDMPGSETGEGQQQSQQTDTTEAAGAGNVSGQPNEPKANEVKAPTFDELLAAADPATRESIQSGIAANAARRKDLVEGLVACEACDYSEEELNNNEKFSLADLERMAKLAKVEVADYSGRAVPDGSDSITVESKQGPKVASAPANYLAATAE